MEKNKETVVFGGGCFWCTEAVFKMLKGITSIESGYAGGGKENPSYQEVLKGNTGHAETIKIEYDPSIISFKDLLTVFFATHDSTTINKQGDDVGEQYRSIILYSTDEQKITSENFIKELNNSSSEGKPIVTEVRTLVKFYPAEEYHKNYYENNKEKLYCQIVINPKLKKVQEKYANLLKTIDLK